MPVYKQSWAFSYRQDSRLKEWTNNGNQGSSCGCLHSEIGRLRETDIVSLEYVDWITEAKTDETRKKRLENAVEWMSEGKTRHWKYQKK